MSDQLLPWLIQREDLQSEKPARPARPKPEKSEKTDEKPKRTRRKKYESGTIV